MRKVFDLESNAPCECGEAGGCFVWDGSGLVALVVVRATVL